ncbi:NEAT domain-containing protein [Hathewaya histolytica]|uniref:NPQTN cell wall surface anchor protein n=1 Tax=Hathewaya histolytica TaxID=1498 RepID=A0A4U9RIN6_HATHI|nr:NEAT domain-containing protein [Hathewaya histolytica]VTQ91146.1 NPQTN cell wall surface anchor protein [Hathewaya histolytica]
MKSKFIKITLTTALVASILIPSKKAFAMDMNKKVANPAGNLISVIAIQNNKLKDGKYNVGIQTLKEKSDELSMAGQYVDSNAVIDVKDGNISIGIKIMRNDWMKNIKVSVDNSNVDYKLIKHDNENKVATLKFSIPSTKSNIKFRANIEPMGNTEVSFRTKLKDDMQKISDKENKEDKSNGNTEKNTKNVEGKKSNKGVAKSNAKELPQTGLPIKSSNLFVVGGLSTIIGAMLFKRRK